MSELPSRSVIIQLARIRHLGHGSMFDCTEVQAEAHENGQMDLWAWMQSIRREDSMFGWDMETYGSALEASTQWTIDEVGRAVPAESPDYYGLDR